MSTNTNSSWIKSAGRRTILVAALIAVVTLFWVALLHYTNLPMLAMAGIALVSIALLSVAVAWAAMAVPQSDGHDRPSGGDPHGNGG